MRKLILLLSLILPMAAFAQHSGTVTGSPTYGAAKFGNGLTAVNASNYVSLPAGSFAPTGSGFTIEAQLKSSSTGFEVAYDWSDSSTLNDLWVGIKNGKLSYSFAGVEADSTAIINDGAWHHVEIDCNAGNCVSYVDGTAAPNGTLTETGTVGPGSVGYIGKFKSSGYAWTGAIDEVAVWNQVRHTGTFTAPTAAYVGNESGLLALYHLQADGTDSKSSTVATITIDPSNAAILYSPYNWNVTTGYARTINSGAYFRTIVSGTANIALSTDTSPDASPYARLWCRVDNQGWALQTLSAGNPTLTVAAGISNSKAHLLECVVSATSEFVTRWSGSQTVVQITGVVLDSGATVTLPQRKSKNILWYGDSITEGYHTLSSATTPDSSDILGCYSWALTSLDAEIGIVGFGGTGITVSGQGGVPALPSSYNYIYSGVARTFSPAPDVIGLNEGENDNTANIVPAYTSTVQALLSAAPNARILLMVPFSQREASNVQSVVTAVNSSKVSLVPTAGWFNSSDSPDGQHPYNYVSYGVLGPKLLPYVTSALYPATIQGRSYTFY